MKAKDLRDQTTEELEATHSDCRRELYELVNALKHAKKVEKPHLIRQKKKDIARLLTVLNEKHLANQESGV
jgi:large subunit ribosomal protein L29